jgi:hypothetical protein
MTERGSNRPELGKLTAGQEVIVRRSPNDMRRRKPEERYIPATVTKVGRVWAEMTPVQGAGWHVYRMRLEDQHEGSKYPGSNATFATLEQHAWDETAIWAREVLTENGIRLERNSRWTGREVELADLLGTVS